MTFSLKNTSYFQRIRRAVLGGGDYFNGNRITRSLLAQIGVTVAMLLLVPGNDAKASVIKVFDLNTANFVSNPPADTSPPDGIEIEFNFPQQTVGVGETLTVEIDFLDHQVLRLIDEPPNSDGTEEVVDVRFFGPEPGFGPGIAQASGTIQVELLGAFSSGFLRPNPDTTRATCEVGAFVLNGCILAEGFGGIAGGDITDGFVQFKGMLISLTIDELIVDSLPLTALTLDELFVAVQGNIIEVAVAEPGTIGLFALSALGFGALRRRTLSE